MEKWRKRMTIKPLLCLISINITKYHIFYWLSFYEVLIFYDWIPFVLGERIYSCFVYSSPIFAPQMHNCTSVNARRLAGSAPSLSDVKFLWNAPCITNLPSQTDFSGHHFKNNHFDAIFGGNRDTDSIILIDNSSAWPPAVWPFWSFETNFIQSTLLDRKDTRTQLCCMNYHCC